MDHIYYLRKANEIAKKTVETGNTPFGAILVNSDGTILMEQGNEENDLHDATAHAERVLASRASRSFDKGKLFHCTLYTTVEPCPMCTGAIYWANIGRIVFGITEKQLLAMTGSNEKNPTFNMGVQKIVDAGQKQIEVLGPFSEVEKEIVALHRGFWK